MFLHHVIRQPPFLVLLLLLAAWFAAGASDFYEGRHESAAKILQARGYQATEFYFMTSAGYKLRLTRGRNKMFSGGYLKTKEPIVFVHGVLATANAFLVNSFGVEPRDFTSINLRNTSTSRLIELLGNEPSARSLALLALNFGHEVWLVDRRGSTSSRELTKNRLAVSSLPERSRDATEEIAQKASKLALIRAAGDSWWAPLVSFFTASTNYGAMIQQVPFNLNRKFWNFSFEEQARVDFPEAIEFVCAKTGSKRVALVTHSSGGAIALMSQSLLPERLGPKLSSQVHWAPAFSVGNENPLSGTVYSLLLPFFESYMGPAPATFATPLIHSSLSLMCDNPLAEPTICQALMSALNGNGGGREAANLEVISSIFYPSSSHELAQLLQGLRYDTRTMHHYDYGVAGNLRAYGSPTPPRYDLARLQAPANTMSFYSSPTDMLLTVADVNLTVSQIQVAHRYKIISEIPFSHVGYFFNEEAPMRVIIPSMQELESFAVVEE